MAGINCKDAKGKTPLHIAIENDDIKTVKILLENNADVNIPNPAGEAPLTLTIIKGYYQMAQYLIQHKPKVDIEPTDGMTLLQCAVERDYIDIIKYLLEHYANAKAEVNTPCTFIHWGGVIKNCTVLHIACIKGCPEIVEMLMAYGADMYLKNDDGKTALHIAVEKKHSKCIEILFGKKTTNQTLNSGKPDSSED